MSLGDCVDVMAGMDPDSVDAIVTDPPYGLEFMGKEWDRLGTSRGGLETWGARYVAGAQAQAFHRRWAEAALRVAKPSSYLLAFGGTRTVHRMTVALEDAGWLIRDMLVWAYASGFPKSKASLKPAWEPIVLARKPGPLRDLNIDATRIGIDAGDPEFRTSVGKGEIGVTTYNGGWRGGEHQPMGHPDSARHNATGRWPANVILTDPIFDGGVAGVVGGGDQRSPDTYQRSVATLAGSVPWNAEPTGAEVPGYGDSGTYSRFFLVPKAPPAERRLHDGSRSTHPTVKPVALMRHLVRLITPSGGTVLDPFLGSGTTAIACEQEGFSWVGIEREPEYVAIAEARLVGVQRGLAA